VAVQNTAITVKCRTIQIYSRQSLSAVGEIVLVRSLCDGLKSHSHTTARCEKHHRHHQHCVYAVTIS